jgi:hypothetical protein
MFSYWNTKGPRSNTGPDLTSQMMGFTAGATKNDVTVNFDFTTVDRERAVGEKDKGAVSTIEAKYRFWREIYGVFNYASSNTARNLRKGSATEYSVGTKMFLYPGSELEILMVNRQDNDDDDGDGNGIRKTKATALQAQLHLFF